VLSHARIWAAIDLLAERHHLSVSGLARRAGLDATTFNRSKRSAVDGRPRWPSTESIAKILEATGTRVGTFLALIEQSADTVGVRHVPVLGLAQAGAGGFFDDGGFPAGQGWSEIDFPAALNDTVFALEVTGESMLPLYRRGDTIIIKRDAPLHRGDRVVVRTRDGEVMAKVLERKTTRYVDLVSLNPDHPKRTLPLADVDWIGRIIWASQ
jgi:phage repressor protein C with HTH and peptisase S24 domain